MTAFVYTDAGIAGTSKHTFTFTTVSLASLANAARSLSDSAWNNADGTTGRLEFAKLRVKLASWTPATDGRFLAWLIPGDGTDFEDAVVTEDPGPAFLVMNRKLASPSTARARTLWSTPFRVFPMQYKLLVKNSSGATLAASGSSIDLYSAAFETR